MIRLKEDEIYLENRISFRSDGMTLWNEDMCCTYNKVLRVNVDL